LVANRDAIVDIHHAVGAKVAAIRHAVGRNLMAIEVAGLLALNALDSHPPTIGMAIDHGRTSRAAVATIGLGRAATVLEHREALGGATLDARHHRAPFDAAHLEAATAARCALHLRALAAAAAVCEAESAAASAALRRALHLHALATATARLGITATAMGNLRGALAAISTAVFAGLGARRRRHRQSGDTRG
jgi:hypothetical protein